jgi:Putative Flp pilus-assembly TadE/G-like
MQHQSPGRVVRRAEARRDRGWAARVRCTSGRRAAGQSIVIFALSVTVLMGLAGLSIDAMRAYDLFARERRAAEAAALAGVIYMPCWYSSSSSAAPCNTASPDGNTAIGRALAEVRKNGFGATATANTACSGTMTSAEVMTCKDTSSSTALRVTINEPISVFFISMLGAQAFTVTASAAADYLAPYVLGSDPSASDSNLWGDSNLHNPKNFVASINGPAEFQEKGDPFVYCQQGPSQGPPADFDLNTATLAQYTLSDTVIGSNAGFPTNHKPYLDRSQCGVPNGPTVGNQDQQPSGFEGEATRGTVHPGAYNYGITVPSSGYTVWVNNPGFSPTDPQSSSCQGLATLDIYFQDDTCSNYYKQYGPTSSTAPLTFDGSHFDDPRFGFNVTYSLYQLGSPFFPDPGPSALVSGTPKTFPPLDMISADLSAHSCVTGAYDMTEVSTYTSRATGKSITPGQGCVLPTDSRYTAGQWTQIGAALPAQGLYRLAVEATSFSPFNNPNPNCAGPFQCGFGRHSYALAICAPGTTPLTTCGTGGLLAAWNNMDIYLNFPSANKDVYLPVAYVPSTYAGRTITFSLFDAGDSHGKGGNTYYMIVPPDPCISVSYPTPVNGNNWVRQATYTGTISPALSGNCSQSTNSVYAAQSAGGNALSDQIYNGLWINATVKLPSSFAGGEFWMDEHSDQGKNFNQMCVKMEVNGGSPLHLIG